MEKYLRNSFCYECDCDLSDGGPVGTRSERFFSKLPVPLLGAEGEKFCVPCAAKRARVMWSMVIAAILLLPVVKAMLAWLF